MAVPQPRQVLAHAAAQGQVKGCRVWGQGRKERAGHDSWDIAVGTGWEMCEGKAVSRVWEARCQLPALQKGLCALQLCALQQPAILCNA